MPRTLAAVLFGFSLLVQLPVFAAGYFVLNLGEAMLEPIWVWSPQPTFPSQPPTTYDAAMALATAEIARLNVIANQINGSQSCRANEVTVLPAVVEILPYPARDPFEAPPRVGWLFTHRNAHVTTITSYMGTGTSCSSSYPAGNGSVAAAFYTPGGQECSVKDIPPFGPPDPVPLDMTNIPAALRKAATCLNDATGLSDGALFASGYRSDAYQAHLSAVQKTWWKVQDRNEAACQDLRARMEREFFFTHEIEKLGQTATSPGKVEIPAEAGCHAAGTCFDVNRGTGNANLTTVDQNEAACGVRRSLPIDDPGHTILFP